MSYLRTEELLFLLIMWKFHSMTGMDTSQRSNIWSHPLSESIYHILSLTFNLGLIL